MVVTKFLHEKKWKDPEDMGAINKHLKTEWEKLSLAADKEVSIQAVGEQIQ